MSKARSCMGPGLPSKCDHDGPPGRRGPCLAVKGAGHAGGDGGPRRGRVSPARRCPGTEGGSWADASKGSVVLVEALAVGVCGTDAEIANGGYGWAPPGEERLILGHESLGRVLEPGPTGVAVGEHVVGIVRRPDPTPCPNCAVGEWDMCSNGHYTERGIKQAHGFMAERWRIEPEYVVRVDNRLGTLGVLLEPTTVVTKRRRWPRSCCPSDSARW